MQLHATKPSQQAILSTSLGADRKPIFRARVSAFSAMNGKVAGRCCREQCRSVINSFRGSGRLFTHQVQSFRGATESSLQ